MTTASSQPSRTWLFKTEPGDYSYADLERDGRTAWDGVGNNLALKHLREVQRGDRAFIYHTGAEKQIIGIANVVSEPYPDPTAGDPRRVVVDVVPAERLAQPVGLAAIKADTFFADFALVRIPRLSVMPVARDQWNRLVRMSR